MVLPANLLRTVSLQVDSLSTLVTTPRPNYSWTTLWLLRNHLTSHTNASELVSFLAVLATTLLVEEHPAARSMLLPLTLNLTVTLTVPLRSKRMLTSGNSIPCQACPSAPSTRHFWKTLLCHRARNPKFQTNAAIATLMVTSVSPRKILVVRTPLKAIHWQKKKKTRPFPSTVSQCPLLPFLRSVLCSSSE